MPVYHERDVKRGGGRTVGRNYKVKRKALTGSLPTDTKLSDKMEIRLERARGGNVKARAVRVSFASLSDPKTGRTEKVRVIRVLEVPANREYARKGVIVKGAIIETSLGKAVVTSRPGQDGTVNAVLLERK
ncbi:MAG: 30S ribosomal protein S8e [Acidilobaceae archaeon]|nr:30S ribosomal protein S8e [Acidilobaceae archaeon]MCX8165971.1 30S ribosomal protein S8e [Acidilobaceae archaeon]MDW7974614.1 30S ribosomal protein S8e [Sulfolobales archaeon]